MQVVDTKCYPFLSCPIHIHILQAWGKNIKKADGIWIIMPWLCRILLPSCPSWKPKNSQVLRSQIWVDPRAMLGRWDFKAIFTHQLLADMVAFQLDHLFFLTQILKQHHLHRGWTELGWTWELLPQCWGLVIKKLLRYIAVPAGDGFRIDSWMFTIKDGRFGDIHSEIPTYCHCVNT